MCQRLCTFLDMLWISIKDMKIKLFCDVLFLTK